MLFQIYNNGTFSNFERLNFIGQTIYNFFNWYVTSRQDYYESIESINIYSLQRPGSTAHSQSTSQSHSANKAVDFAILPLHFNLFFFSVLHQYYQFNIYLSAHNRHIHVDHLYTRTMGGRTVQWKNEKRVEYRHRVQYVNEQRQLRFRTNITAVRPHISQFLTVPEDYRAGDFNLPILDRYGLSSWRNDFESFFANALVWRGETGHILYRSRAMFEEIIPENNKRTPPAAGPYQPPGPAPEREGVPWKIILLTLGGLGALSLLSDTAQSDAPKIKRIEFE